VDDGKEKQKKSSQKIGVFELSRVLLIARLKLCVSRIYRCPPYRVIKDSLDGPSRIVGVQDLSTNSGCPGFCPQKVCLPVTGERSVGDGKTETKFR